MSVFLVPGLEEEHGTRCRSKMDYNLLLKTYGDPLNLTIDGMDGCFVGESIISYAYCS